MGLFAFKTVNMWLDFYFEMLRIWQSGDQRIALYKVYEQWSCLPPEKQIRLDGPVGAPYIEDKLYESKRNSMFPSLGDKSKKKTASDVLKSQSKPRKARPTPAPKMGQWRTLGRTKQKTERRKRTIKPAAVKPLSPPSISAQQPLDSPPYMEIKSAEQEEKSRPSSVPPSGVGIIPRGQPSLADPPGSSTQTPGTPSAPSERSQPWTGLGRYGQRWVNSPQGAQPCVSQTQTPERPSFSKTWSTSEEQTAAGVLRKSLQQTAQPQQE